MLVFFHPGDLGGGELILVLLFWFAVAVAVVTVLLYALVRLVGMLVGRVGLRRDETNDDRG